MNEIIHDDFKFTMHSSGNVLSKSDVIGWAMSDDINDDKSRIVYENDEIGIHHSSLLLKMATHKLSWQYTNIKMAKIISLENWSNQYAKIKKVELKVPLLN